MVIQLAHVRAMRIARLIKKNVDLMYARTISHEQFGRHSAKLWLLADETPEISAGVHNLIHCAEGEPLTRFTAEDQLEQFYRYTEAGLMRGGKFWLRPSPRGWETA